MDTVGPLTVFLRRPWRLSARFQKFDGCREHGEPVRNELLPAGTMAFMNTIHCGATFDVNLELGLVAGREDALDGVLNIAVTDGASAALTAALELVIGDWSREHWLLLPAAAYNGNRFHCEPLPYAPILPAGSPILCERPPVHITDVPRLNDGAGDSRIQLLTGDLTTPAVAFHDPTAGRGCILLFEQGSVFGNHGVTVTENDARSEAVICVEAPGVRRDTIYAAGPATTTPSPDRGAYWQAGDRVALRFRLFEFAAPVLQDMFDRFAAVRKDLTGPVHFRHLLPFSAAWALQEEKYNRDSWDEQRGRYMVGVHRDVDKGVKSQDWQPGWVGGGMATQALIFTGTSLSRERAVRNLDWMLTQTQASSGFLRGMIWKDTVFDDGYMVRHPHAAGWSNVRRNADVLFFVMKQVQLLAARDTSWRLPASWRAAIERLADRFVKLWETYGQLGQIIDINSGAMVLGGSSGGAIAPAGLALAAEWFSRPEWLAAAEEIARHYLERDARQGLSTGGPAEILQCPDSESAFGMLESFAVLWEITRRPEWLAAAADMGRQCATWVASYDYRFPAGSILGRLDSRGAGTVWANVQNKHSAPGICTLSGDSLLKVFRGTGDRFFLDLAREIAHALPQYLSRADRPVGDMPSGWMCERVNFSDWEGFEHIGGMMFGPCWCEVSLMLSWIELPGVYAQTDTGLVGAFDHVDALVTGREGNALRMRLHNPTRFPARVRVLAECAADAAKRSLGCNALLHAPVVDIPAGGAAEVRVTPGQVVLA